MFCKHCGKQIDDDVIVCPGCGKQVQDLKREPISKNVEDVVNNKDAWYYEWWFIILMFFVFFPLGISLLVLKLK